MSSFGANQSVNVFQSCLQDQSIQSLPPLIIPSKKETSEPVHVVYSKSCKNPKKLTQAEQNARINTMQIWFEATYPTENLNVPRLPFLRLISGEPKSATECIYDWPNMYLAHLHSRNNKNENMTLRMKMIAKEAIIYGLICQDKKYQMPENILNKYANLFNSIRPQSKL